MGGILNALRKFRSIERKWKDTTPAPVSEGRAVDRSKTVGDEALSVMPVFDVDIPLDEDLSVFQEQSKHALHEEAELDFDLTDIAATASYCLARLSTSFFCICPSNVF